jgi:hypothetical protein
MAVTHKLVVVALVVVTGPVAAVAQGASDEPDLAMYARIRDEGLSRSRVMDFAFDLMDRIGARLTGSPNLDRAVSWAVDRLTEAGLDNVRRDRWGEFGMQWRQRNTWVTLVEPDFSNLQATAAPWSPPTRVNRALARRYLGHRSPVDEVLRQMPEGKGWEIVGVVDDIRQGRLDEEPYPQVFMDSRQVLAGASQRPGPPPDLLALGLLSFAVRVSGDPMSLVADIRALVREVDPSAILDGVTPMEHLVSGSTVRQRLYAVLLGIFAAIAAVLATVGVYGLLAYLVTQRNPEIGIYMTLGARPADVRNLVLRQGAVLIGIGVPIGLVGAIGLTRYLSALLFGLTPVDPPTYALVAALFTAVALVAAYIPSRAPRESTRWSRCATSDATRGTQGIRIGGACSGSPRRWCFTPAPSSPLSGGVAPRTSFPQVRGA